MNASDQDQYHTGYLAGLVAESRRDRRRLDPSRGRPEGRWWRLGFDDGWSGSDALRDFTAQPATAVVPVCPTLQAATGRP